MHSMHRFAWLGACALWLAAAALPAAAQPASWAQWRGPRRDGVSRETGLLKAWPQGGPRLLWSAPGLGSGYASVAIVGGKAYTMGDLPVPDGSPQQYVMAFDLATRKRVWTTQVGPPHEDGPRCTPTVDGDRVYALGTSGDLVCVNAATGAEVWRANLQRDLGGRMMSGWRWSESPLVDGDRVVVTPGTPDSLLAALDKRTGKVIWQCSAALTGKGRDGSGYSSIVPATLGGVKQYVQMLGRGLVGVSAADGKLLWSSDRVANGTANITTPIVQGDLVFASTAYGAGSAVVRVTREGDNWKAEEVWYLPAGQVQNHHGGVVLLNGYLYGGHGQNAGAPFCVEMATGKVVWKASAIAQGSAAVLAADGALYFRYEDGTVALVAADPAGYRLLGSFTIPNPAKPTWAHPVVLGKKLYLRNGDTLLCYDVQAG